MARFFGFRTKKSEGVLLWITRRLLWQRARYIFVLSVCRMLSPLSGAVAQNVKQKLCLNLLAIPEQESHWGQRRSKCKDWSSVRLRRLEKIQTPFILMICRAGNPAFRLKFVGEQPEGWVPRKKFNNFYLTKNLGIVEYIHYAKPSQKQHYYRDYYFPANCGRFLFNLKIKKFNINNRTFHSSGRSFGLNKRRMP